MYIYICSQQFSDLINNLYNYLYFQIYDYALSILRIVMKSELTSEWERKCLLHAKQMFLMVDVLFLLCNSCNFIKWYKFELFLQTFPPYLCPHPFEKRAYWCAPFKCLFSQTLSLSWFLLVCPFIHVRISLRSW